MRTPCDSRGSTAFATPSPLATLCALFLVGTENVAHEAQRDAGYIRNHESVAPPAMGGGRLVFWAVRGAMAPEAQRVTVDLSTFQVVPTP